MAKTPIGRIDLQGLLVFDAVMRERHVTRAAESVALSQPAASHALARLRTIYGDQLFIKVRDGVKPTRRAQELWGEIQGALATLRKAMAPGEFDLSLGFTVSLAVNDMVVQHLMPVGFSKLMTAAPHMKLIMPMRIFGSTEMRLLDGTLDFAVGLFNLLPASLQRREIWNDSHACIFRKGSPASHRPWNVDTFTSIPHVDVSPDGEHYSFLDAELRCSGVEREVRVRVSHYTSVPVLIAQSDMVATLPRFYAARAAAQYGLELRDVPVQMQPIKYEIAWHERVESSPALLWFRDELVKELRQAAVPLPIKPG